MANIVNRYPELPRNVTPDELQRKWSELIRALNDRDQQPIPPVDVFGRNIEVGGSAYTNLTFVTAATSVSGAPTPDFWHIYEYQIPRDAGMVFVQAVSVSAGANVQIRTYLPRAELVESRTITIAAANPEAYVYNTFNLGIFPTSGCGNVISTPLGGGVTVNNAVSGSISLNVSTAMQDTAGNPLTTNLPLYAVVSAATLGAVGTYNSGTGIFTAARNNFTNTVTGGLSVQVSSVATYSQPLNYTLRAFGNRWVQII